MGHTETPYIAQNVECGDEVSDQMCIVSKAECREVATIDCAYSNGERDMEREKATAEFIFRACNEYAELKRKSDVYDDLVKALEELSKTDGSEGNIANAEILAARVRSYALSALTKAGTP